MKMSVLRNFIPINNPIEKISKKKGLSAKEILERERENGLSSMLKFV